MPNVELSPRKKFFVAMPPSAPAALFPLICIFLSIVLGAQALAVEVKIGEVAIEIPLPGGFERADGVSPALDEKWLGLAPLSNRLLATFAMSSDLKFLKQAKPKTFRRYMIAQTLKESENTEITAAEFETIILALAKQFEDDGSSLAQSTEAVNEEWASRAIKAKAGDAQSLGILHRSKRSIDFGIMQKSQVGEAAATTMISANSMVLVRGKVVYLYVYSEFESPEDIVWARKTLKAWRESVLANNLD